METIKTYLSYLSGPWASYVNYVGAHPKTSAVAIVILAVLALVF